MCKSRHHAFSARGQAPGRAVSSPGTENQMQNESFWTYWNFWFNHTSKTWAHWRHVGNLVSRKTVNSSMTQSASWFLLYFPLILCSSLNEVKVKNDLVFSIWDQISRGSKRTGLSMLTHVSAAYDLRGDLAVRKQVGKRMTIWDLQCLVQSSSESASGSW